METENTDNFASFEKTSYEEASKKKRFLNYVIDYIAKMVIYLIMITLLGAFNPSIITKIESNKILEYVIAFALTFAYYHLFELFTGKTLGKMITKTKVLDSKFNEPTSEAILYRSLYRLVPFDALSFIGEESEGWHDKWSNTIVVNEKEE